MTGVAACLSSQIAQGNGKIYKFFITFANEGSQAAQISIHTFPSYTQVGSGPGTWTPPAPFTLNAGETVGKVMFLGKNHNQPAGDGAFTLNFMVDGVVTSSGPWPITNINSACPGGQ